MTECALKQALDDMIDESQNYHSEYYGFIGASKPMQALYQMIEQVALTQVSVFITGESGTGKELCAEAIHKQSQRKDKPFIIKNGGFLLGSASVSKSEIFFWLKIRFFRFQNRIFFSGSKSDFFLAQNRIFSVPKSDFSSTGSKSDFFGLKIGFFQAL
jgi:transcriptional regulator of aromatic amino acid metabolism